MNVDINAFVPKTYDDAIDKLEKYLEEIDRKKSELCRRLAEIGAVKISLDFARAIYTGEKDVSVSVESRDDGSYAVVASGQTVLLIEFGAGVTMGGGHPEAQEFGMGVGTYPGQTHAFDPNGWYLPRSALGNSSDKSVHTYGNPPSMTMYNTEKDLEKEIERVAKEVLLS